MSALFCLLLIVAVAVFGLLVMIGGAKLRDEDEGDEGL